MFVTRHGIDINQAVPALRDQRGGQQRLAGQLPPVWLSASPHFLYKRCEWRSFGPGEFTV